jgi:beta-phosphoglucomutase
MKAVIFDMDGVIIDSQPIADKLSTQTAKRFGVHLTEQQLHDLHGGSTQSFWTHIKKTYNLPEPVDYYIDQYDVEKEIRLYKNLKPIKGITELIVDLHEHNVALALATSASLYRMQKVLDLFGMRDTFEAFVCANDVTYPKPDPEIFLKAAGKLNTKPEECVVIEDAINGLLAAHRAGMKCVLYWRKKTPIKTSVAPSLIIKNFTKVTYDILKTL